MNIVLSNLKLKFLHCHKCDNNLNETEFGFKKESGSFENLRIKHLSYHSLWSKSFYWIWTSMKITLFNPYSIPLSALNSKGCSKKFAGFLEHPLCYPVNSLLGGCIGWLMTMVSVSTNLIAKDCNQLTNSRSENIQPAHH